MEHRHLLISGIMALMLLPTTQTTASAQLGRLIGTVKQKAREQVENQSQERDRQNAMDKLRKVAAEQAEENGAPAADGISVSNEEEVSGSNLGGYEPQFQVDYSKARHSDWDYQSGGRTVEADFAYWMQRLTRSLQSGKPGSLDWEAAWRINTGKPSFDFLDNTYHLYDGENLTEYEAEQWQFERKAVLKRFQEIEAIGIPESPDTGGDDKETKARKMGQYMVDKAQAYLKRAAGTDNAGARMFQFYRAFGSLSTGVTMKWTNGTEKGFNEMASTMQALYNELPAEYREDFPAAYDIASLQAFDEARKAASKQKKPNAEIVKMKKGALLTQYKTTLGKGETVASFSGHQPWLEEIVAANCPEWGTPKASRVFSDYKVETNVLGIPVYRTFTSEVICEDQGYLVCHEVFLKQDYEGGQYGKTEIRPGGLDWNAACRIVK